MVCTLRIIGEGQLTIGGVVALRWTHPTPADTVGVPGASTPEDRPCENSTTVPARQRGTCPLAVTSGCGSNAGDGARR